MSTSLTCQLLYFINIKIAEIVKNPFIQNITYYTLLSEISKPKGFKNNNNNNNNFIG